MATFYIISTINAQQNGWEVYGTASTREAAQNGLKNISDFKDNSDIHRDIYAQTLAKNARIVSATWAKRRYGINENYWIWKSQQ